MEYGLSHELPIYAGGLGVLSGDFIKAAHDLELPLVAIGILWRQDYTEQFIGEDGRPYDVYPNYDYSNIKDTGKTVTLRIRGEEVTCKIRLVDEYGNAPLYLLDTNYPGSNHGWMTNRLYGGVAQDRIAQELILGIGGVRALRVLDIDVDVYHFNEGHAVFAGIELIREKMQQENMSFEDAWTKTRQEVCFTTHTPVAAGNESHDHGLLQHMEAYNGLNHEQMSLIGGDPFNMTKAALRLSTVANAVSKLHGKTARDMWKFVEQSAPIISITNGVHPETWQSAQIREAFENGGNLWNPHMRHKEELIDYIKEHTGNELNPRALTIGFARRAAPYKRSHLIFKDIERIEPLLKEGKIQLVFSGKAHPRDQMGKDIIQDLVRMDKKYGNSVVFLENYNMDIARLLVRGCDVWLNNPKRPMEASGTSGMKAAMNGVLNLSVVDGWVAEGCQHGISGWLICSVCEKPIVQVHEDHEDTKDVNSLYKILFEDVIPTFYNCREKWLDMMRASIDMAHYQFSTQRMVREYFELLYSRTYNKKQASREPAMVRS